MDIPSQEKTSETLTKDSSDIGTPVKEPEKWDFGHLTFQCSHCGHVEIMQHDVEDGIMITLPATDSHELKLVCSHCNNMMRIFWQKSNKVKEVPEEKEKEETNEKLSEENKEEQPI